MPKSLDHFLVGHLASLIIKLRFVRAVRMRLNNQCPFENARRELFEAVPEHLIAKAEQMLHYVQPGKVNKNVLGEMGSFKT